MTLEPKAKKTMENNFELSHFIAAGELFLNSLNLELAKLGINTTGLPVDHLCFRVASQQEYHLYKKHLSEFAILLTESQVNGRWISTFQLASGFKVNEWEVNLLELPAPKPGTQYSTGFEHAEFVIKQSFLKFAAKYPQLNFTESGNKNLNPELSIITKIGKAKFHHISLSRIIEIEKANITDIIFDLDGTLIQSREKIYAINRLVFSEILQREVSIEESIAKFSPEFPKLFEAFEISCPELKKRP